MNFARTAAVVMACMLVSSTVSADALGWRDRVVATVRPGAVVARRGLDTDPITQAVLWGQGGGKWSHVGIAVQLIPNGPIYIESAMPGVGTKLEKPEVFFNAEQATDGEVLLMPADNVDAVQSAAKSLLGRPFDDQLELDDDGQKLYCTELVAIALRVAGVIKDWPTRSAPFLSQKVIAPDDLIAALPLFNFSESPQARNIVNQSCSDVRQRPRFPLAREEKIRADGAGRFLCCQGQSVLNSVPVVR